MKFTEIRLGSWYAVGYGRVNAQHGGLYKAQVTKLVPPKGGGQGEVHVVSVGYMNSYWNFIPQDSTFVLKSSNIACGWDSYWAYGQQQRAVHKEGEAKHKAQQSRGSQLIKELNAFLPPDQQVNSHGLNYVVLHFPQVEALLEGIRQNQSVDFLDFL